MLDIKLNNVESFYKKDGVCSEKDVTLFTVSPKIRMWVFPMLLGPKR